MGRLLLALMWLVAVPAQAAGDTTLKNRFGDPFFQVANDIESCPEPRGPNVTEEEAIAQTHHRLERGLRCYLEKRCRYPSSYQYDAEIAEGIKAAVRERRMTLPHSSLWILVQGRRVYVYGCVPSGYRRGSLEKELRRIPDVEAATEQLRVTR
jgi:hypothetical protein